MYLSSAFEKVLYKSTDGVGTRAVLGMGVFIYFPVMVWVHLSVLKEIAVLLTDLFYPTVKLNGGSMVV